MGRRALPETCVLRRLVVKAHHIESFVEIVKPGIDPVARRDGRAADGIAAVFIVSDAGQFHREGRTRRGALIGHLVADAPQHDAGMVAIPADQCA